MTSIANPSGHFPASTTIVLRSEPSGLADSTRPPPRSRKKMRPEVSFLACVVAAFVSVALMCKISIVCVLGLWKCAARLRTKRQGAQHHVVLCVGELLDRLAARLLQHAVDDGLFECRCDVGHFQILHHALESAHQVLHEVMDAARAAAKMPLQALA